MTKAKNPGKLTAKPAAAAVSAPAAIETGDFPDAMSFINSLAATREGVEWDCRVYKVESMGRGRVESQPFLFNVTLEDLPQLESQLAEMYLGGGTFRVQVRADNQLVRNIRLDIAARPGYKPPPPSYMVPAIQAPAPAADSPSTDRMEMFFQRLAQQAEESARQTRELITSLARAPVAAGPTMMEQMQLFKQMQELLPKGAQENGMDLFQKGMDFATKLFDARGGGDGGASWLDVVKEALASPVVQNLVQGAVAAAAAQAQNGGQVPQIGQQQSVIGPHNAIAAQAIDTLIRQAHAGVDPKFVAGQVQNSMPPEILAELEMQSDIVGFLISRFPQVAQHKPWFDALVAEIWEEEQSSGLPSPTLAPQPNAPQQDLSKLPQA